MSMCILQYTDHMSWPCPIWLCVIVPKFFIGDKIGFNNLQNPLIWHITFSNIYSFHIIRVDVYTNFHSYNKISNWYEYLNKVPINMIVHRLSIILGEISLFHYVGGPTNSSSPRYIPIQNREYWSFVILMYFFTSTIVIFSFIYANTINLKLVNFK